MYLALLIVRLVHLDIILLLIHQKVYIPLQGLILPIFLLIIMHAPQITIYIILLENLLHVQNFQKGHIPIEVLLNTLNVMMELLI